MQIDKITAQRLAVTIKEAARIREESWKSSCYDVTIYQASLRAANEEELLTIPVSLLLTNCWNEALAWAEQDFSVCDEISITIL